MTGRAPFRAACGIDLNGIVVLLISGTASIDENGETVHVGDFRAQMPAHVLQHHRAAGERKAPPGRTSCAPPATCATSTATTPRSTKSARRSTRSRDSIRCRPPPAFRRTCAGRTCWWKSKRSPCSAERSRRMKRSRRRVVAALARSRVLLLWRAGARRGPCSCGANPPGPAAEPRRWSPTPTRPRTCGRSRKFTKPYYENYTKTVEYNGAARDVPTLKPEGRRRSAHRLSRPDRKPPATRPLGRMMLHGAQLAIEEANAARRLRRQAVQADDPQRPGHLGRIQQRNRQDGLRREGLGHARLHQRRFHAHRAARFAEGRGAHRQQRRPPTPPFRRPSSPGSSPPSRTTACRATRWRAASTPTWACSASRCCASTTATAASASSSSRTPRAGWAIRW